MKYIQMNDELADYLGRMHSCTDDPLFAELRTRTAAFGGDAIMQIPDHQGTFLTMMVRLCGAVDALEIGTFTGHSSICIARGLPEGGRLLCLDMNEQWTAVAQEFWKKAGLDSRIELQIGDAIETVAALDPGREFDFVHIDAEKTLYDSFYESVLPRVRTGGLILFDNMLRDGEVVHSPTNPGSEAIKQLNLKLTSDARVENVLLEVSDGIQVCRKV